MLYESLVDRLPRFGVVAAAAGRDDLAGVTAAMRIELSEPGLAGDLIAYLRRCDCTADERALARLELDAYLRVWRAMHPEVKAEPRA